MTQHQLWVTLENLRHEVRGLRFAALGDTEHPGDYTNYLTAEQAINRALTALNAPHDTGEVL